jgi:peroxiredoxin Q/BCP
MTQPKTAPGRAPRSGGAKPPQVGDSAPKFRLASDDGSSASLADFAGKWVVIYFYPKDSTPGCTVEARDFSDAVGTLQKHGATVLGVSKDSVQTHCSFREKVGIRFPLLSDPELTAHRAYGAWGPKVLYGRKFEGTIRSTFLISPDGRIVRVWTGVKVNGHVSKVLDAIREAQGGVKATPSRPAHAVKKAKTAKKKNPVRS